MPGGGPPRPCDLSPWATWFTCEPQEPEPEKTPKLGEAKELAATARVKTPKLKDAEGQVETSSAIEARPALENVEAKKAMEAIAMKAVEALVEVMNLITNFNTSTQMVEEQKKAPDLIITLEAAEAM